MAGFLEEKALRARFPGPGCQVSLFIFPFNWSLVEGTPVCQELLLNPQMGQGIRLRTLGNLKKPRKFVYRQKMSLSL